MNLRDAAATLLSECADVLEDAIGFGHARFSKAQVAELLKRAREAALAAPAPDRNAVRLADLWLLDHSADDTPEGAADCGCEGCNLARALKEPAAPTAPSSRPKGAGMSTRMSEVHDVF